MKSLGIMVIGAGLALILSGCGGPSTPEQTEAPLQPVLSVPTTSQGGSATLAVYSGDLEKGTKVDVYAFPLGWETTETDCTDTKAEKREVIVSNKGTEQNITFQVESGVTAFVLAGPGFSTPCNAKDSHTVQKNLVNMSVSTPKDSIATGKDAGLSIETRDYYADEGAQAMDASVKALGPWKTIPEASAAECEGAPVAQTKTVKIEPIDKGNLRANFPFKMTFKEPGVYRLVSSTPETERTAAFESCAGGAERLLVIK